MANSGSILWQRIASDHWRKELRQLVERHADLTGSRYARDILDHWEENEGYFWQVCPKDMVEKLAHPLTEARQTAEAAE